MTPDLYAAWLAAGNNLQPYGAWIAAHWIWLVVAASATATIALQLRQKGDQQ
ncbi:hypothetical protein [Streptomyces sp. NPDC094149]|uniref:hypothetical protein n=1 Tax=Streptomyces sp. NPDC094149 TaxID=3155079 RepID=UPI0033263111